MRKSKRDYQTELEKKAEINYYTMRDGAKVRVLDFNLAKNPHEYKIFLVPGFITVFQSWHRVVELLSKKYRVYYFESREKASSKMPWKLKRKINLHKMAFDIKEVIEQMNLDQQKYIVLCSSTGGTIEIEALKNNWHKPAGAVMVGPTVEYHVSHFGAFLVQLVPGFIKNLFMPILRWYLGKKYVDAEKEPEQRAKYVRAAEEADIWKIRRLLRQFTKYKCWDMVPEVTTPVLLIGASVDKMHSTEECLKTHELMPNSQYIDLGSNKAAHSDPLVKEIEKYIEYLKNQ
ncbi:MAG: alpha/beta hydrolase [Asgard group archaeon]|nr:alpha/beta hydrolase [Asgard group archaeon]